MAILEKLKNILKNKGNFETISQKEPEVTFLSDKTESYTLYFRNTDNKYVFVGDINYPYSKTDLDREWIDMNKHNFEVYEVFNDLSQLFEKNKEVVERFEALQQEQVETIQDRIDKAKEKAEKQISSGCGRDPLKIERNGTTL